MDIIFLGTGTGVPSVERSSPGIAVLTAGETFLIDSGSGTLRQLEAAGIRYTDLDFILYTHFHPDHVGDLVPFLFATRYFAGFHREQPVIIYGPKGLLALYGHLREAFGHWVEPPEGMVIMKELPLGEKTVIQCGETRIEAGPVPHTPHSLGYRLTEPVTGPVAVFTGDTDDGPELVELAKGADLLVTECSFPDGMKKEGHLTPGLAGRIARQAGVRSLALTHFYPETKGQDLLPGVRSEFNGPVTMAEDLMRIHLV